jgi:type III restriction enzyme
METGTGKTYCYIKTIFELNKQYGWSKFIIVVPSIAIREGVASRWRSRPSTSGDLPEEGALLHLQLQAAAPSGELLVGCGHQRHGDQRAGVCRTGADNRRIYEVLDDFQSRRRSM